MAFSQTDLDAIDRAIAVGALKVDYADGRSVTYRSLTDLMRIRDIVAAAVGVLQPNRIVVAEHRR